MKPKPQRADNGQVEELVRKLTDARMDTSAPDETPPKQRRLLPVGVALPRPPLPTLQAHRSLRYARRETTTSPKVPRFEGVHKVANDLGEGLNKSIDDFRNKKLFDFGFNEPTSVSVRDGDKHVLFQKSGENWTSGKQTDGCDQRAVAHRQAARLEHRSSLSTTGFTTPVIELSVTSDDGKRVEKVQISKIGNQYFAKRENEPAIYELDSKSG